MRVHTYVIATDAGSAPNYDPPFVTLAVCKPVIRRKASIGDLVLAFAGKPVNPYEPHAVVWAGVVTERMTFSDYWSDPRFAGKKPDRCPRPDNFYRPTPDGGLLWVDNRVHGPEATTHDTGGIYVLAFNPSWRFGANGPVLPESFGLRMTNGRRGQHVTDLSGPEWQHLEAWLDGQSELETSTSSSGRQCTSSRRTVTTRPSTRRRNHC